MTAEQLVDEFAQNVAAQSDAILRGDPDTGNKHADRYIAAFRELKARGAPGRDALAVLLKHRHPDVRCISASCLLRYRNAEAKAVLEELARGDGLVALGAEQSLANWKAGTWALDPG